jgi:cobalt-zinc-cadmium efflux system membrane fusion protein
MTELSTPPRDEAPDPVPRDRQLRRLGIAAGLLLLAVIAVVLIGRITSRDEAPPNPAAVDTFRPTAQQLKTLDIETVTMHRFATIDVADGRIAVNGDRTTPVFSPFSGRIVALLAKPGDRVAQGETLATIEATEFADAQNNLAAAVAQARLARAAEIRKHGLFDAKGGSQQDWQQAQAELAAAEAALSSARNHLRILGQSDAAIAALETQGPADARIALRAPVAGVVIDRQVGPGQYVTAGGGTPLYTVADLGSVWAVGALGESAAPRVRRGQAVTVEVLAWPSRKFVARLDYVAPAIDPLTHRLPVRAVLSNADGALKPEMLATLRIEAGDPGTTPAVPAAAVVYEGERAHVWLVAADGTIGLREIHAGRGNDDFVEVLDGLKAGERVVTRGSLFIDHAARHD